MAARRKKKRSISSLISATECCRRARREAVLKTRLCALSVRPGDVELGTPPRLVSASLPGISERVKD